MKFLKLQMIPKCFHPMSGHHHHRSHRRQRSMSIVKLIKPDGIVKIYNRPVHVSELTVEFPKHLVCRSDSFYIGQKIPHLSDEDMLQPGHNYFLLPKHCFQTVLSFVTIASFSSPSSQMKSSNSAAAAFLKKAAGHCRPFNIEKTPSGCLKIRVSDEFISHLMEQGKIGDDSVAADASTSKVCSTPQLVKDYSQLVSLGRQWKPKLETIKEKGEKKRKLSSFGIKRKSKKSQSSSNHDQKTHQKSEQPKQQQKKHKANVVSVKPSSRTKIKKIKNRK